MHQIENHSCVAVADSTGGGVQQLSALTEPHLLQQEQSPQAQPLSSHQHNHCLMRMNKTNGCERKSKCQNMRTNL